MLHAEELTYAIIGAAMEVHNEIGPGILEEPYEECLAHELSLRGLKFQRQLHLPINYKGLVVQAAYRIDLLVEDQVIVELKAVEKVLPVHEAQLLTYLRLSKKQIGLLINFNVPVLKEGITRRVL